MEQLDNNEIFDDFKPAEEQTAYVSDAICNVIEKELSEVEHEFSTIKFCQHEPKFIATNTWILISDFTNIIQDNLITIYLCFNISLRLVEGLYLLVQTAKITNLFHLQTLSAKYLMTRLMLFHDSCKNFFC